MAELSELRTRLEGSFERVERMAESLERAAARVDVGKTGGVIRLLEARQDDVTVRALTSVERLAANEEALQALLTRFHRAEERLRAALLSKAATIGVYEGQSLELARLLEREQVLFRGHAVAWREVGMAVLVALAISLRLSFPRHSHGNSFTYWWIPALVAAGAVLWRMLGPKLVVTPGFVRIGKEVLHVPDVKELRITTVVEGTGRSRRTVFVFTAISPIGVPRELLLRAAAVPDAFVEALMLVGVQVRRENEV